MLGLGCIGKCNMDDLCLWVMGSPWLWGAPCLGNGQPMAFRLSVPLGGGYSAVKPLYGKVVLLSQMSAILSRLFLHFIPLVFHQKRD